MSDAENQKLYESRRDFLQELSLTNAWMRDSGITIVSLLLAFASILTNSSFVATSLYFVCLTSVPVSYAVCELVIKYELKASEKYYLQDGEYPIKILIEHINCGLNYVNTLLFIAANAFFLWQLAGW